MLIWFAASATLCLVSTAVLIRILRAIKMLDHPGQRRLHAEPVLRGGGLAIALCVLTLVPASAHAWNAALWSGLAGLLIAAGIGWLDDRCSLGIAVRLFAHACAGTALWFALSTLQPAALWPIQPIWLVATLLVLSVIASINLHNFIDGANGMLAWQTVFVILALLGFGLLDDPTLALVSVIVLGAVLGFLPFNFPRAKTFLGDVGSGALGYLLALLTWSAMARGLLSLPEALVLHSLVLIDTLSTLFIRMAAGRRWWNGHREHLYQWLIRAGRSHAQVVIGLQLWNVFVVLPALLLIRWLARPATELVHGIEGLSAVGPWLVVLLIAFAGASTWRSARRGILRRHRAK